MIELRKEAGGLRFFQEGSRKLRGADRLEKSQNEFAEKPVTLRFGGRVHIILGFWSPITWSTPRAQGAESDPTGLWVLGCRAQ